MEMQRKMDQKMAVPLKIYWVQFFKNAGFPLDLATEYAVTFSNHQIKPDMLPDLDKPSLKEMGITLVGDMLAILRYAKKVTEETTWTNLVQAVSAKSKNNGKLMKTTKSTNSTTEIVKKAPERKSVFDRLGDPVVSSTTEIVKNAPERKSVFDRLGDRVVSSTTNTTESPNSSSKTTVIVTGVGKDHKRRSSVGNRLGSKDNKQQQNWPYKRYGNRHILSEIQTILKSAASASTRQ